MHILLTAWLLAAATAPAETAYYRVDLAPSGSLVAMGAPVTRGGMILVKGYPDGKLMSLRKSDIKSITAITAQEAAKPSQREAVRIADLPMQSDSHKARVYRMHREGYAFVLDRPEVEKLKSMPDFEGREEPAIAEDFLRFRAESWADVLSSAGAEPGQIDVSIDPHQKKAHLKRAQRIVITADI